MRKAFKENYNKGRSLYEIVNEEGSLRTKDILYIVKKLCLMDGPEEGQEKKRAYIHPKNLIIRDDGEIDFSFVNLSLSDIQLYLPPELDRSDFDLRDARVYSLGMLMLFMATGKERKTDAEAFVGDRFLFGLIESCTAFDPKDRISNETELLTVIKLKKRIRVKVFPILSVVFCAGLTIIFALYFWRQGGENGRLSGEVEGYGKGYSEGYEQGLLDAPGIGLKSGSADEDNGNLSGNYAMEKGAVAARGEEEVFFLLKGNLYKMNPYTQKEEVLAEGISAHSLNYYEGWLYYCSKDKVLRMNPYTQKEEIFCESHSGLLYVFHHNFYLYDKEGSGYLYKINPKTGNLTQLNGSMLYKDLNILDEKLYYIDPKRGENIYRCDLDGGNMSLISSNSYEAFCIYNEKIYASGEEGLVRMELNGGNPEQLIAEPTYFVNVSDGGIFYVSGKNKALEWMALDGRTVFTIVPQGVGGFNVVGQWVFYENKEDEGRIWRIRNNGSDKARL